MAVERVRASRTDPDMDVGGSQQKLLKIFPGEGRRRVSTTVPRAWIRLFGWLGGGGGGGLRGLTVGGRVLSTCPRAVREPGPQ